MRLVITGTRRGRSDVWDTLTRYALKHGLPELVIVGDQTGVDAQAWQWAMENNASHARIYVKPQLMSPRRFHDRNQRMVDLAGPGDMCLGFPDQQSRGTFDCMKRARARGLEVMQVHEGRLYFTSERGARFG